MYCPQCGNASDDTAGFCTKCGMDLKRYREQWSSPGGPADQPSGYETDPARQAAPTPSAYPPPYQQQYQPTHQTPPYQAAPYQTGPAYQNPGYYQAGANRPGYGYGTVPNIPSYMGWAIATLILCFWPTGIVAVVYASKVGNRLALGDLAGAQEASRKAKTWTWVTFGIGVALVIMVIVGLIVAATTVNNGTTVF
jgi:hypothetical protein